ncbi:MAG: helicase-related protein [Gammaproteobacteria bacterium]
MAILDNHDQANLVGEHLRAQLRRAGAFRIVSAYFSVYAYAALRDELEGVDGVRFLYGDPGSVGEVDFGAKPDKDFQLTEQGLLPKQLLRQKRLAADCAQWIKERVTIRAIKQTNFLHGKMYHIERPEAADTAVLGSSNFTSRGLGFGNAANLELNLSVTGAAACDELKHWFDRIWRDKNLTEDATDEVLDALRRLGQNYSPELVYYKTLLEIFSERLRAREDTGARVGDTRLKDTTIWQTLYPFQRDGVYGVINRLEKHNGCILADSVGLGKTYTALAVIRYYQERNQRVLVLCPKKLSENWKLYSAQFGQLGNPFAEDKLDYTVLYHTDLSRTSGESNGIKLAEFDWASFGLVVIDESHNFRNDSRSALGADGEILRRSRYERLLRDVIIAGGKTNVLMLSATPVNTSLADLRNQIYFMSEKRDDAFQKTLGIGNFRAMLNAAQKVFKEWERQSGAKQKSALLARLGGDFFHLLDAVSIARSRRHVKNFYPEVVKQIGGFPEQMKPDNRHPPTDLTGALSYETLNAEIEQFQLSVYTPAAYVVGGRGARYLDDEKKSLRFNQRDREKWLIGMIRVNFLKRLESAAPSLALTLERTIKNKIDRLVERIERYLANQVGEEDAHADDVADDAADEPADEPEDEDFIVNKVRRPFHFKDLDLRRWLQDLRRDRAVLVGVHEKVAAISPERDGKLRELRAQLREKIANPSTDKDARKNPKVLVFTAFKDTAQYLYEQLQPLAAELDARCAMVAGDSTTTTYGKNDFNSILTNFAPIGRGRFLRDAEGRPIPDGKPEIDILFATDCISEGQNLQDCDLVVNYDIHWNPVRLIQRFGRIDRIGSRNRQVRMVNYWPMPDLERYLNLKNRVEARMALADATATGDEPMAAQEMRDGAEADVNFRDAQMRRLHEEVFDLDEFDDGVSMSDFSFDDFIAQLMNYLERNRAELERAPPGIYALADCARPREGILQGAAPGVIFCLRHRRPPQAAAAHNPLGDYYLVYVRDDGEVRYNYTHAKQVLELFGELAREKNQPLQPLCDAFDRETGHGRDMEKYDKLLDSVFAAVRRQFDRQEAGALARRDGVLSAQSERPRDARDFELVTWLVIKDSGKGGGKGGGKSR